MKNKSTSFLLGSAMFLTIFFSCNTPVTESVPELDMDKVRTEIQAMEDAYAVAQNAKNGEGVVAYYADDAVNMPNDKPIVSGKANILARVKAEMAADTTGSTTVFKVQDIWAEGNLAVETGTSVSTDAAGNVTTGKYMSVFEKRDGKYVCVRDIWNSDAPTKKLDAE